MKKNLLPLIILIMILSGCDLIYFDDIESETATPTIAPTPSPTAAEPKYIEDPSELGTDCNTWPYSITLPYIDYDPLTETTEETQAAATKLVTPRGYTMYLIKGYHFRELIGGITVSPTSEVGINGNKIIMNILLEIMSYDHDIDIKQTVTKWMQDHETTFYSEEYVSDDPAISYIAYGQSKGGVHTRAYMLEKANGHIVIAYIRHVEEFPEVVQNIVWMAKTFRLKSMA